MGATGSEHNTRIVAVSGLDHPLRMRRLACGLTQAELAVRAGVSRQLVAAVEAGRNVPAVDAALALAGALSSSVEQLFGAPPPAVSAALGGRLPEGAPLRVGRVGERLVAAELSDHGVAGAGWAKPDGVMRRGELKLFDGASTDGLVVAGCDPALGVAEAMLTGLGARSVMAISASTGTALKALASGAVHAAVVHDRRLHLPPTSVPVARWHLARWQVGLAVPSALGEASVESVFAGDLQLVQRDRAASSQHALERAVADAGIEGPPAGPLASGHIEAARMAALLGAAAITTEGAARAFGLCFRPLEEHVVEIWVAAGWLAHPGAEALAELLGLPAFTERVAQFGGYDLTGCGTVAA
jgi:DNA-binding XRE family transcriptional regulator